MRELCETLSKIVNIICPPHFRYTIGPESPKLVIHKEVTMPAVILPDTKKTLVHVQPVDALGNPTTVDGGLTLTSTDATIVTTDVGPDPMSFFLVAGDVLGTAQVKVDADADLGPGVTNIEGVIDVTVVASQATDFAVVFDAPVDK